MIYLRDNNAEAIRRTRELLETEGRNVPRCLDDMLIVYGDRYSDENVIRKRKLINEGDGSDALHWSFPVYARQWTHDRAVVGAALNLELSDHRLTDQLALIDEATERMRQIFREKRLDTDKPKAPERSPFEDWLERVPSRYRSARYEDFGEGARDHWQHVMEGGSMLMVGGTGVGKTHFLWAMANEIARNGLQDYMRVTTLQELLSECRTYGSDWSKYAVDVFGSNSVRWLFVDECDKINGSDNDVVIVSTLVDTRYSKELCTVFVGNGTRDSLVKRLGEPVVSRLTAGNEGGRLFVVSGDDRRTRNGN